MATNNWRFWIALSISVLLLSLLLYRIGVGDIGSALHDANYLYVAPAIGLYFVAVYFRALRWRYLLSPLAILPVGRLYPVIVIGYMANNLLPARLGELVRSYYLARREQLSTSAALATVAVERVYDGVTLLAFAALSAPVLLALGRFAAGSEAARTTWLIVAVLTVALFFGALLFLTSLAVAPRFVGLAQSWTRFVPGRFRAKTQGFVYTFVQGLSMLKSPRQHVMLFVLSVPVWLMEGAAYFVIAYSFGIDDVFGSVWVLALAVLLVTATSNLATSVPTAIGGIGPFEVVAQQTLLALGVAAPVGAAYAGVVHLVALWLPVNVAGLFLAWKQNLSIRGLAQTPRTTGAEPAAGYPGGLAQPKEDPT